jgi:hypothetical protein
MQLDLVGVSIAGFISNLIAWGMMKAIINVSSELKQTQVAFDSRAF